MKESIWKTDLEVLSYPFPKLIDDQAFELIEKLVISRINPEIFCIELTEKLKIFTEE